VTGTIAARRAVATMVYMQRQPQKAAQTILLEMLLLGQAVMPKKTDRTDERVSNIVRD